MKIELIIATLVLVTLIWLIFLHLTGKHFKRHIDKLGENFRKEMEEFRECVEKDIAKLAEAEAELNKRKILRYYEYEITESPASEEELKCIMYNLYTLFLGSVNTKKIEYQSYEENKKAFGSFIEYWSEHTVSDFQRNILKLAQAHVFGVDGD